MLDLAPAPFARRPRPADAGPPVGVRASVGTPTVGPGGHVVSSSEDRTTVAKIVGVAATLVAAFVAQKAVEQVGGGTAGHKPPGADDEGDTRLNEVVAAAAVTGAVVSL